MYVCNLSQNGKEVLLPDPIPSTPHWNGSGWGKETKESPGPLFCCSSYQPSRAIHVLTNEIEYIAEVCAAYAVGRAARPAVILWSTAGLDCQTSCFQDKIFLDIMFPKRGQLPLGTWCLGTLCLGTLCLGSGNIMSGNVLSGNPDICSLVVFYCSQLI